MSTHTAQEAGASMSPPPREDLFRALSNSPTLERKTGEKMPTMVVDFARFSEWTMIDSRVEGRFMERLAPGSMDKTITEQRDQMRVLFNHGKDPSIGDKVLGPITDLTTSAQSARGVVPLLDTSYNADLIPGLDAGLYGASFRFQVMQEDFVSKPKRSDYNPRGLPERTITEARVREWGPVTFGAYAGATAGLRSITADILMEELFEDEAMVERIKTRLGDKQRVAVYFGGATPTVVTSAATPGRSALEVVEEAAAAEFPERDTPSLEPEPSEAATPATPDSEPATATRTEPEPSAATTRSHAGLFWFADTSKLKGAK